MGADPLRDVFEELRDPLPRTTGAGIRVLARQRRGARRRWLGAAAAALLVAGGATLVMLSLGRPSEDPLGPGRWRGVAAGGGAVALDYAVEGPAGGVIDVVGPVTHEQRVLFYVTTDGEGFLCLEEQTTAGWERFFPAAGDSWTVSAGKHWPGGEQPLSFRTDLGAGRRAYRVLFDPADPACVAPVDTDEITVVWEGDR